MLILGIDPGLSGAITSMRRRDGERGMRIVVYRMPSTWDGIADLLVAQKELGGELRAVVERLQPMPARRRPESEGGRPDDEIRGSIATWKLSANLHLMIGMLVALRIPFETVPPQTWQKGLGLGKLRGADRKRALVSIARQRFPMSNVTGDIADSLLLAEYGWKMWMALEGSGRGAVG